MSREGTNQVDALVARIYGEKNEGETNERLGFLARRQVVAHLKKLEEDGRAVVENRVKPTGRFESSPASTLTTMGSMGYSSFWW